MPRAVKICMLLLLCPLLLTGCWDLKSVQDINYIASIGFDYKDQQYIAYVQLLDFSAVAKTETGKPTQHIPIWIGKGRGETVDGALNDLYRTAQSRLFFGQINAIVLGENLLKQGIKDVRESIRRYYEMRYTPWFFATKEPIDALFQVTPFFNMSPMFSLLQQPWESYKQQSLIPPMTIREFAWMYNEPTNAAMIPSLTINRSAWQSDVAPKPVLDINGVFVFENERYLGWMKDLDIPGLRWMETRTNRSPMLIRKNGKPQVALSLERPRPRIRPIVRNGTVAYRVDVKLTGIVGEVLQPVDLSELRRDVSEQVAEEIRRTYKEGLKIHADLLGLEHVLYRNRNGEWKRLRDRGKEDLTEDSLELVKVDVNFSNSERGKLSTDSRSERSGHPSFGGIQ